MTRKTIARALGAAALGVTALPAAALAGDDRSSDFDGRIVSVDRSARTFSIRDLERGTQRIRVTSGTRFERIGGFGSLRRGLLVEVDVRARRSRGGVWLAIEVERSGRDREDDDRGRGHETDVMLLTGAQRQSSGGVDRPPPPGCASLGACASPSTSPTPASPPAAPPRPSWPRGG